MKHLEGKVAVVTGAASGIGRSSAVAFAEAGMDVALSDIDEAGMKPVQEDIIALGRRAITAVTDVRDKEQLEALRDKTLADLGDFHLIMNNAGIIIPGDALDSSDEDWKKVIDIDLWGVVHGCRVFGPHLRSKGDGHIVNTASGAGLAGIPGAASYSTAKFAVVGLSESLRYELAEHNVGVTAVCPGVVNTSIIEKAQERMSRPPSEIIRFAASPDSLAKAIVKAVRNNEPRLVFGWEAQLIVGLRRFSPFLTDQVGKLTARASKRYT